MLAELKIVYILKIKSFQNCLHIFTQKWFDLNTQAASKGTSNVEDDNSLDDEDNISDEDADGPSSTAPKIAADHRTKTETVSSSISRSFAIQTIQFSP